MNSDKITFVIPSRDNLEYLKLCYQSLKDLKTEHYILVLDDNSKDGTQDWIKSLNDPYLITYHNPGPDRIGIVGMFDKGIEMSQTDIIFTFHADMVASPDLDKNILKHLKKGTVVTGTRVEPPLHPSGPEKITRNFGIEVDEFDIKTWYKESDKLKENKITQGIFAPWCMYKEDFLKIGGHDPLFAPQSKEDSDIFNTMMINGYKFIQSWEGLVYHFTSRGSRFNKHHGGGTGVNSEEWKETSHRNMRNFIRKWGHEVRHDQLMKPIIPPKYDIQIRLFNSNLNSLFHLEPWCNHIVIDTDQNLKDEYISIEQPNTLIDLNNRISLITQYSPDSDIIVRIDSKDLNQENFKYISLLPDIINKTNDTGEFEVGSLNIKINRVKEYIPSKIG